MEPQHLQMSEWSTNRPALSDQQDLFTKTKENTIVSYDTRAVNHNEHYSDDRKHRK